MAMAEQEEELALRSLLDAFPASPLELIASSFTQAHGDPQIAAQLIANFPPHLTVSQNCSASSEPPLSSSPKPSNAKKKSLDFGSRCPPLRPSVPGQPTLLDYFPPPPQENAWIEPLQERLDANATMLKQLSLQDCRKSDQFESEFPCLGVQDVPLEKSQIPVRSAMPNFARSSKRVSAASGIIPNVRTRPGDTVLSQPSATLDVARTEDNAANRRIKRRGRNTNTRPTEIDTTEEFLLTMLGDGFKLGIEAVRDVLGHHEGDVEKSLEDLIQMTSSSSSCVEHVAQNRLDATEVDLQDLVASKSYEGKVGEEANKFLEKKHPKELGRKSNIHQYFEEEMLKQEHSSMKWMEERLCKEFPSVDVGTLKEVLYVTNFNYSDAEKMLLEAGAKEDSAQSRGKIDNAELSNVILESFFKAKEDNGEKKETNTECPPHKKPQEDPSNSLEPVWKVVTASESSTAKCEEATMQVRSYGDWDDYERHHTSAKQHWLTMEQYFKAASAAYASGDISRVNSSRNLQWKLGREPTTIY